MAWDFAVRAMCGSGPCELNWSVGWLQSPDRFPAAGRRLLVRPTPRAAKSKGCPYPLTRLTTTISGYLDLSDHATFGSATLQKIFPSLLKVMLEFRRSKNLQPTRTAMAKKMALRIFEDGFLIPANMSRRCHISLPRFICSLTE